MENQTDNTKNLYVEDVISQAIFDSVDLMSKIYLGIHRVQKIKINWCNVFSISNKLDNCKIEYDDLFAEFQKKYIIDLEKKDQMKIGLAFNVKEKSYSYFVSSIVAAMRNNLKNDPNVVNKDIVLMGLFAQQMSYENLIQRFQDGLRELNSEIVIRYQGVNNIKSLLLNSIMLILTGITIGLAYWSIVVSR